MYLNAWLIGDDHEHILDDLIAPDGIPPAKEWIPLDSSHPGAPPEMPGFRSAYGYRESDGVQWIDFAIPPSVIREWIGPRAMVDPRGLAYGKALRSNVETREGIQVVKVSRYFDTFGSAWTFEQVGRDPLITIDGEQTGQTTVGNLDLDRSFLWSSSEPVLIIDDVGPRLFSRRLGSYYNVMGMTKCTSVLESITSLSPDTPVRCVWFTF